MGYSLTSMGQATKNMAMGGLRDAAMREKDREATNKSLKAADRQQTINSVTSGAALGFMAGGPVGAAIGGVGGLVLGELF